MNKINFFGGIRATLDRISAHEKRITIATLFTIARIVLAPMIVVAMVGAHWGVACFLFLAAAFTDLIDGFLARYLDQKTFFGACLDPVADKLLLLSCFFTLAFVATPLFYIPRWFFIAVCMKECMQVMGAVWLYFYRSYRVIEPTLLGKLTTTVQVAFIVWLFMCYFFNWVPVKTYYLMLGILFIVMSMSFIQYVSLGVRIFNDK